jgi:hypothetical protein
VPKSDRRPAAALSRIDSVRSDFGTRATNAAALPASGCSSIIDAHKAAKLLQKLNFIRKYVGRNKILTINA